MRFMKSEFVGLILVLLFGGTLASAGSPEDALYERIYADLEAEHYSEALRQFSIVQSSLTSVSRNSGICGSLFSACSPARQGCAGTLAESDLLLRSCASTSLFWVKGVAFFNKGDFSVAQKYFQRMMLAYPDGSPFISMVYFYNAECYFHLQKWDEAVSAYRSVYVYFPTDSNAVLAMAREVVSLANAGKCVDAQKAYRRSQNILIDYPPDARDALARCEKGQSTK